MEELDLPPSALRKFLPKKEFEAAKFAIEERTKNLSPEALKGFLEGLKTAVVTATADASVEVRSLAISALIVACDEKIQELGE